jgi:hypothetical protein
LSGEIPAGGPYKAATGHHEVLSTESIKRARGLWPIYCTSGQAYCDKFKEILLKASELTAKARLEDLGPSYDGIDAGVIKVFNSFIKLYGHYIGGVLVARGEKVLVTFKVNLTLSSGISFREGDVAFIDVEMAVGLGSLGLVEPALTWSLNLDYWLKSLRGASSKSL